MSYFHVLHAKWHHNSAILPGSSPRKMQNITSGGFTYVQPCFVLAKMCCIIQPSMNEAIVLVKKSLQRISYTLKQPKDVACAGFFIWPSITILIYNFLCVVQWNLATLLQHSRGNYFTLRVKCSMGIKKRTCPDFKWWKVGRLSNGPVFGSHSKTKEMYSFWKVSLVL